jgi:hypothetical protein
MPRLGMSATRSSSSTSRDRNAHRRTRIRAVTSQRHLAGSAASAEVAVDLRTDEQRSPVAHASCPTPSVGPATDFPIDFPNLDRDFARSGHGIVRAATSPPLSSAQRSTARHSEESGCPERHADPGHPQSLTSRRDATTGELRVATVTPHTPPPARPGEIGAGSLETRQPACSRCRGPYGRATTGLRNLERDLWEHIYPKPG